MWFTKGKKIEVKIMDESYEHCIKCLKCLTSRGGHGTYITVQIQVTFQTQRP